MPISFDHIPANIRVPFFWAEVDNSQASYFQNQQRALLIGQKIGAAPAVLNQPVLVTSEDQAIALFGQGSHLARMMRLYRQNDTFGEVWCLPVGDGAAAVAATGTLTVTGTASAGGVIFLYIAGQLITVGVASGDTAATVGTAIRDAINAVTSLPVTATNVSGAVTVTAKHPGLAGNEIDLRLNWRGPAGGETLPAGIAVAVVAMASGSVAPALATGLDALGDELFDFVALAFSDATSLDAIRNEWSDEDIGRWSWARQIYGHVFAAKRGTVGALQTFGAGRNDPHVTVAGYHNSPTPPWEWAAAWAGQSAKSLRIDPARPLHTLALIGIIAPPMESRFVTTEKQTLLFSGVATWTVSTDGIVRIERSITTYQKNEHGQPDPSYLDIQTLFTLAYVLRFMRQAITQKFGRHKLANDGTNFGQGQAIVTPRIIRAELVAQYSALMSQGLVENIEAFKEHLIVERNPNDPNRVDVLYTPDLVNQLRIFAVNAQFHLQYPQAA